MASDAFGEWHVNSQASAEGFTVIFNEARDKKKTNGVSGNVATPRRTDSACQQNENYRHPPKRKWSRCG